MRDRRLLAIAVCRRYLKAMISDADMQVIKRVSRKYGVARVLLFGSALDSTEESRDIDIAVDGIADSDFYAFYGDLLCALSKPVDVVDLSSKTRFSEMVRQEGVVLHG